jgi:DNA-binding transcriptional LysR family regulator
VVFLPLFGVRVRGGYPNLRIQLISEFSNELIRGVTAGELNLALVTAPAENSQITAVAFAQTPLYAVLPPTHAATGKELIALQDLAQDEWILFGRRAHPLLRNAILDAARSGGITPKPLSLGSRTTACIAMAI